MADKNRCVVLARRPDGAPTEADFALEERAIPALGQGQILCENLYISLDAGFRNWMDEDSGDNVLPAMPIGAPVMGLTLSRVLASRHDEFSEGDLLMARFAWEEYTVTDAGDFISRLPAAATSPLSHYLGVLGDTGLSAYFGLLDYGAVREGETVLVSAAAGAVGSVAGQIVQILGGRAVGIASGPQKCARLIEDLGYDAAIDRLEPELDAAFAAACPDGIDVYFDNVGGPLLETVLDHINEEARILLCGSVATYNAKEAPPGPRNLFALTTKHAHMHGFMTHLQLPRYDEARTALSEWIEQGLIKVPEYRLEGIESVPRAFCDLFRGLNFGKTVVSLVD